MNKKTLMALAVFIVLGGLAWYVLKKPPKGQRVGERPRPVPELKQDDIYKVTLARKDKKTIVLVKSGDGKKATWSLEQPVKYKADKFAAEQLVDKLTKLSFGDLVTEQQKNHAQHQVDEKSGVHVTVANKAGKTVADLWIGKIVSGYTMVRPNGKNGVWQAAGPIAHAFKKDAKDWRDRTIFKFNRHDFRHIDVTTAAGTVSLARKDKKAPWTIEKSPRPIKDIEKSQISGMVSSLYSLTAYSFADDVKPADAGLDKPQGSVSFKLADGKSYTLHIGKNKKDDFYVKRGDSDQVFVIKRYTVDQLMKRPVDFRSMKIMSFKPDDVVSMTFSKLNIKKRDQVTLTRKGKTWVGDGKKIKSDKKVKTTLSVLSRLRADRWAHYDAAAYGLDKQPSWIITVTLKDKTKYELKIGETEKDGFYGAQKTGEKDLYALRKYKLGQITLEPKNFK
ncbi:MAG: DUF4340 domain-containing protein [Myxococcales bacterium]|nr:DUF4340 domain-containing protein [Myxococcales bacterium]